MRKILPLILCVSLLLCATACFRSDVDKNLPQGTASSKTTTTTAIQPVIGENPSTFPWIGTITSVDGVNVRSAPDSSDYDNVIASGMYGDRVKVVGQEGQWYKVMWEFGSDDIQEAYISAQFVQ